MTCTTPLPERLDPPDAASECAVCHRVTEDGRDLELCDEAVDALLDAGAIRRNAAVDTGVQFVCESCLDDLYDAQDVYGAISEAFDTISDALGLDEYEHPALRARKMVQRIQSTPAPDGQPILAEAFADNGAHSHWYLIDPKTGAKVWSEDPEECAARGFAVSSPAPVAGGVPQPETFRREDRYIVLKRSDLERHATPSQLRELKRTCEMVRAGRLNEGKRIDHYVVVADDWPEYEETWEKIQARVEGRASRLPAIKPGEVVVDRSVDARKDRCVNLLREIVEDLKRFDSPEMRRLAPRTVEAVNEFAFRGWAGLQAIDSARAQATTSGEETPC